ncbi:cobalt ECF transporter T component CbiQ [Clostridium botulinum]|uniref:Cobalt ABC transporter, inner membrane subunit CbiQ n=1 Tax=Clostridium botulinum (strain Eklund 17B / Type B) TaxID=935198 RepID=B2TMA5_CLOBB|nr:MULTISPECIES: cobalt ECF transporter T component CbiQ [unclassified Clostridium]ACD22838.1 cobalt ABC transporter, inner membrane subunit CbiQ [Clostridium botulinum B str. Eklund 17B (NRP)]MBN1052352.1 cobalt ECF transporter T component CbiQ [Clostridium botulinum]MBY6977018.1 cobalt ECF transporter T component CbiQ [Clostridium botulinum]MBY6999175.1 cobalt ECF transporter T component CbiQ [Clostridium botulinum]MCR1272743.1 cobalt ECF transporter T component CbiQ [Clostridium botulinum]
MRMEKSLYNIRYLDELSEKVTIIHNVHPLPKVLTTIIYLIIVVSFSKYEISGLIPLILYPMILMILADIKITMIIKRLFVVLPFVICIGIFNPLLDHTSMLIIGNMYISGGWISFISILIKCALTVAASLILIATTGINKIALSLRLLKVPKLFVIEFLLTYRYITVLIEEVGRITRAYSVRSHIQKGIRFKDCGCLIGQLLIKTVERAERIYISMCCRGFERDYDIENNLKMKSNDYLYVSIWIMFFIIIRCVNIPKLLSLIIIGVN